MSDAWNVEREEAYRFTFHASCSSMSTTPAPRLLIADSERDANQLYATGMLVPDPFIVIQMPEKTVMVLSDLELERGRREAHVDEILALSIFRDALQEQGNEYPKLVDIAEYVLHEYQIQAVTVPGNFALQYADELRQRGISVQFEEPFFPARSCKTAREIAYIQSAQRRNEDALQHALQILTDSEIGADDVLYYQGTALTSEYLRTQIQIDLLQAGCMDHHTIVACGEQATRPHNLGSGPLFAHQAIILDIFPYCLTTRYFADMTRTVVKGRASDDLKRMYAAVQSAQELAIGAIRAEAKGQDIHRQVQEFFTQSGFETGSVDGVPQGFFHGTGHGLGLEIHEPPRIGNAADILKTGHVVTVEPGLYYPRIGGVRLEDLVVVTDDGCTNLTQFPKELELL